MWIKLHFFIFFSFFCLPVVQAQPENFTDTSTIDAGMMQGKVWAYASQSVINIHKDPGYTHEMTTQALLGTPMKILAKKSNWSLVQTPDGYEGWTSAPLIAMDSATLHRQNKLPRVVVMDNQAEVRAAPRKNAPLVAEVVMGNILWLSRTKKNSGYYEVSFPDGRKGYIKSDAVKTWQQWQHDIRPTGGSIEMLAKKFTGIPYVWGGASPRGLDCSGLTKTTYLMHGIILPRDARQQYLTGQNIDSAENFVKLKQGDLLFFGKKYPDDSTRYNIVHTAIYLQQGQFIQAGNGYIQISSLNPADSNFDAHNAARYVTAKRILSLPNNGTWNIFDHPWYQ